MPNAADVAERSVIVEGGQIVVSTKGSAMAFSGLTQNGLRTLTSAQRQGSEGRISGPPVGERPTRLLDAARRQARDASHSRWW